MRYKREQERLKRLWEELKNEDDIVLDDQEDSGEEDQVEERDEDSESEQELDNRNSYKHPSPKITIEHMDPVFIGKDTLTQWKKHPISQRVKTRAKNIVTDLPGIKGRARSSSNNILDIWSCFFTDDILNILVEHTNLSITQQQYSREYRTASHTDIIEMKALLELLYLSAVCKTNLLNTKDLWKTNGTSI